MSVTRASPRRALSLTLARRLQPTASNCERFEHPPMNLDQRPSNTMQAEFSLTRGDPLYRALSKVGLTRYDGEDYVRLSLFVIAVGWFPPTAALSLGVIPTASFWTLIGFHVRFLITVPLLLLGEEVLDRYCRTVITSITRSDLVKDCREAAAGCVHGAERLTRSPPALLIILLIVAASRAAIWRLTGQAALASDVPVTAAPTIALYWYGFVSLPLFTFIVLRCLWHWAVWARLLWTLARLPLHLVASHPDHAGGLGRLSDPTYGIALVFVGLSSVLSASWSRLVLWSQVEPTTFAASTVVLLLLAEILAFGPLLPFARLMVSAGREGRAKFSTFALTYMHLFERRWFVNLDEARLLGTEDIQSMADLISTCQNVEHMQFVPFRRDHAMLVLWCVVGPMAPLPLLGLHVPFSEIVKRLLSGILLGGS